jgi:photosystem II stability/assembly factor-like uncharacterized protein
MNGRAPGSGRLVLLAVLATLDVVLVAGSLRLDGELGAAANSVGPAVGLSPVDPFPSTDSGIPGEARVLLDAAGTDALRVRGPGTCGGDAALEKTTDGGRTWTDLTVPAAGVLRVALTDSASGFLVGTDTACTPAMYRTEDGGQTWTRADGPAGVWHRAVQSDVRHLHSPSRRVAVPCREPSGLADLASLGVRAAAVLCTDGSVYRTSDSGVRWAEQGTVTDATAIAFPTASVAYAAAPATDTCGGVEIRTSTDGGAQWEVTACLTDASPTGGTALSFSDARNGMVLAGDATYRTNDGGVTWTTA